MGAFRAVVVMAFVVACGGGGAPSEEREIADPLLDCDVDQPSGTVTLCHATDSVTTPYVFLHVNEAACVKAHGEHAGDFLSADPRCIPPPLLRQTYVKASNADAFDDFGYAVAISGDTMAVGAPYESSNGDPLDNSVAFSGAVYVFVRSAGSWVQQAYLKPAEPHEPDQFGLSIALDGNTLVAAAPFASTAYVFTRANGAWSQQAELRAGNADPGDGFGCSVGISFDTVVVGAYAESSAGDPLDNSVPSSGAAYCSREPDRRGRNRPTSRRRRRDRTRLSGPT
jgi:hypothetical protein